MVGTVSSKRVTQLSDAMLLLEVVECIRAVMNNRVGLEYFINHPEPSQKLILGTLPIASSIRYTINYYFYQIHYQSLLLLGTLLTTSSTRYTIL